tara:strand:- start:3877 stop:4581 length:705 start_codon:yes stop_codon:yes gene_type:complete
MRIKEFVDNNVIFETPETIMLWFREDRNKYKSKIIKAYLPLAYQLSMKVILTPGKTISETFSDALFGLNSAIDKFNPDYGDNKYQFFEYAKNSMNYKVWAGQRDGYIIKQAANKTLDKGLTPTYCNTFSSLMNDNRFYTFEENLKQVKDITKTVDAEIDLAKIINETNNLTGRTKYVIIKYLGLCEDEKKITFKSIGKEFGVSQQHISQIYKDGIKKLRNNKEFKIKLIKYYEN